MLLFYPDITGWFLQQPLQVRRWQCVQIQAALACKARDGRPRHLDMMDVSKQRIFSRYAICYPMLHPSGVAKSTHPSKSTSANKVLQRHAPNLMSSLAWHSHVEVSFRSALRSHGFFKSQTTIWPHALRHWWLRIQLIELFFRELEDVKLIGKLELFLLQNSWHFPSRSQAFSPRSFPELNCSWETGNGPEGPSYFLKPCSCPSLSWTRSAW